MTTGYGGAVGDARKRLTDMAEVKLQRDDIRENRDRLAHQVADLRRQVADLRSRLACVQEATTWDRPYDVRLDAIRGMCDLASDGMTPTSSTALTPAQEER